MLSEIRLPLFQTIDQQIQTIGDLANYDPLVHVVKERFQREINQHLSSLGGSFERSEDADSNNREAIKNNYLKHGHNQAVTQFLFDLAKQPLTRTNILLLTEILIGSANYRKDPTTLIHSSGSEGQTPAPEEIPNRLKNLLQAFNQQVKRNKIHPLVCCTQLHHGFTLIHPFNDWNGRIARLLLNAALMNQGYLPILIRKEDRRDYYEALEQADHKNLLPLVHFMTDLQERSIQEFFESSEYLSIKGKFDLETQLSTVSGNEKCLVLTEDSTSNSLLSFILESSGFRMNETQLISYEGCSKIASAHLFSMYVKKNMPGTQIIVHRDRDYLTPHEINKIRQEFQKIGVHFFSTKGTDIESHFLNANHIQYIYPKVPAEAIRAAVSETIEEVLSKSTDYLFKKEFGNRPANSTHLYGALVRLAKRDKFRFTHGKTALRVLQYRLKNVIGRKAKIERKSPALEDKGLLKIAQEIWPT